MRFLVALFFSLFLVVPSVFASMGIGDRGDEVLAVQKQLVAKGFSVGDLDGRFGLKTENAVKSFQYENKLEMTGELDKASYLLLMDRELPDRFSGSGNISLVRRLVSSAMSFLGVPYVFGGVSPSGFDCSGFIQYVFASAGIVLPRMADEQYFATVRVDRPREGDLVFFETYCPGVSHVGMYLGRNEFIHASSNHGISVSSLDSEYWGPRYVGAGRVFN